jgi:hypothetical protein
MDEYRDQYDIEAARGRLMRDASRPLIGPTYDPHRGSGRRPPMQAIRPLSAAKSIALYAYTMLTLIVVVATFIALYAQPAIQLLPDTR